VNAIGVLLNVNLTGMDAGATALEPENSHFATLRQEPSVANRPIRRFCF
jgi:hypothetical protein